jgi:hypothetical protein
MNENHEPLREVRKSFEVAWYRCPIEPAALRELTGRSDQDPLSSSLGDLAPKSLE